MTIMRGWRSLEQERDRKDFDVSQVLLDIRSWMEAISKEAVTKRSCNHEEADGIFFSSCRSPLLLCSSHYFKLSVKKEAQKIKAAAPKINYRFSQCQLLSLSLSLSLSHDTSSSASNYLLYSHQHHSTCETWRWWSSHPPLIHPHLSLRQDSVY